MRSSAKDSPTPVPDSACDLSLDSQLALLADAWSIVVAAKGESDEPQYVVGFADNVEDLVKDVEDAGCEGAPQAASAAGLNFEAVLLATPFKISPPSEPEEDQYEAVADSGQDLVDAFRAVNVRFIAPDCHGQVDETDECTALG